MVLSFISSPSTKNQKNCVFCTSISLMSNYNPQFNREAQTLLWVQWVFFSLLGWTLGMVLITNIDEDASTRTTFGIIAAVMGLAQWFVLRRYLRFPSFAWVVATSGGYMVAQVLSQNAMNFFLSQNLSAGSRSGGLVLGGLIGIIVGLCLGTLQAILLRPSSLRWYLWLISSVVGWGLGFQLTTLFFSANWRFTSLFTVLVASVITGLGVTQFLVDDPE